MMHHPAYLLSVAALEIALLLLTIRLRQDRSCLCWSAPVSR
jgi:hypothetical protein